MSNASLKEQLQAVASQLSDTTVKTVPSTPAKKMNHQHQPRKNTNTTRPRQEKVKPKWLEHAQYGVELLKAYFPLCFKTGNEIKPLKKGIKQDLVKSLSTIEGLVMEDKACMIKSLSYYVNTAAYHKSVVEGALRVGLTGDNAGNVSAEEAKYSIERQQAKLQARQTTTVSKKAESKDELEVTN